MYVDVVVGLVFVALYLQVRSQNAETPANKIFFELVALLAAIALMGATYDIASASYGAQVAGIVNAVYFVLWIAFILELAFLLVAVCMAAGVMYWWWINKK